MESGFGFELESEFGFKLEFKSGWSPSPELSSRCLEEKNLVCGMMYGRGEKGGGEDLRGEISICAGEGNLVSF